MSTVEEHQGPIDARSWVELKSPLDEGLSQEVFARLAKSDEVKRSYADYRFFVSRDSVRAWLAAHAPDVAMPKSLLKRKRVLRSAMARTVVLENPHAASPLPAADAHDTLETAMAKTSEAKSGSTKATTTSTKPAAKKKAKAARPPRPSAQRLRAIHARLSDAKTKEARKAIYEECGYHPAALARWFRAGGLEKVGSPVPVKKGVRGRPRKDSKAVRDEGPNAKAKEKTRAGEEKRRFKIVAGLSMQAREMAIGLLAALLAE